MHCPLPTASAALLALVLVTGSVAASSSSDRAALIAKHQSRLDQAAEAVSLVSLGVCRSLSEVEAWEATAFQPLADDGLSDEEIEEAAADAIRAVGPRLVARAEAEGADRVCGELLAKYGPEGSALPGIVATR